VLRDIPSGGALGWRFGDPTELRGTYWQSGAGDVQLVYSKRGWFAFVDVDDDKVPGFTWDLVSYEKTAD
jgi:hypothetical protein